MNHKNNISKVFSLRIPAEDIQQLEEAIQSHLEARQFSAPNQWSEFMITAVSSSHSQTENKELISALSQATEYYDQLYVPLDIIDSSIPLLTRMKQSVHQLVLFYVNKLGEKQTRVNDRILRVINPLVNKQLQQETEIAQLKEEIAQLKATIAQMEQKE